MTHFESNNSKLRQVQLDSEIVKALASDSTVLCLDTHNQLISINLNDMYLSNEAQSKEVHDIDITTVDNSQDVVLISYWNQTIVNLFLMPNLKKPLLSFDLTDYVSFPAFQIELGKFGKIGSDHYLLLALSNGFLLSFNFYQHLIGNFQQLGLDPKMMVRLCNIFKIGASITDIQNEKDHFIVCADTPKILSQCPNSKYK